MIWRGNLTSIDFSCQAHGCKLWVTNLLIVPRTLGILTANITYCIALGQYIRVSSECMCSGACITYLVAICHF